MNNGFQRTTGKVAIGALFVVLALLLSLRLGVQLSWADEALDEGTSEAFVAQLESDGSDDLLVGENKTTEGLDAEGVAQEPDGQMANAESPSASKALRSAEDSSSETDDVVDGDYVILSSLANNSVLDVEGGSESDGANVQLYQHNGTDAQKWSFTRDENDGLYVISSVLTGKPLETADESTDAGANIQIGSSDQATSQKWRLVKDGLGWRFESALLKDMVLDVSNGSSADGANIQLWYSNGTAAQLFFLLAVNPEIPVSTAQINAGAYTVRSSASGKVLDISSASREPGANVQQYVSNSTYAQRFYIEPDGNGYYSVFCVGSGLALDVQTAGVLPGTNVQQYLSNGTKAQLWRLVSNSDGTVTFISCVNGLALEIAGASTANGANVQVYIPNGTAAQRFLLDATDLIAPEGAITLYSSAAPTRAIDVSSGSTSSGAAMQVYSYNGTPAQRFVISGTSDGLILKPLCSFLYVAPNSSGVVEQSNTAAQWSVAFSTSGSRRGVVFLDASKKAMTASSSSQSATLKMVSFNGQPLQAFVPANASIVKEGYFIISASDGRVIDISGASFARGANVQVYTKNGTGAQVFSIEAVDKDTCRIVSSRTYQYLDAQNGGSADNTNVWQYDYNGTNAQLWRVSYDEEGRTIFTNVNSGKVMAANGGNVCLKTANGADSQKWTLIPTSQYSATGNTDLDKAIARILEQANDSNKGDLLKAAFDHVAYNYWYIEGNRHWSGWSLSDDTSRQYALEMVNNGGGNCYRFASLFGWCAKVLGYTSVVMRIGWVVGYSTPQAPHGWVTVNGYVCDPEMQYAAPYRNWYWQTYSSAPTAYYSW